MATVGPKKLGKLPPATLPSLFTLANLLCGFAAIFYASKPNVPDNIVLGAWSPLTMAAVLVFTGMVFDALDGRVARITNATSDLGAQLDSMADMVTFGIAPAFMAIQLVGIGTPFFGHPRFDTILDRAVLVVGGIYVACTALRLARFNLELDDEHDDHLTFQGLPSPGAGGTVASLVLLHEYYIAADTPHPLAANITAITMVTVGLLVALAMVSTLRYSHVVNRHLRDRAPFEYIVMVVVIGALAIIRFQLTLAGGFTIYALSGPVAAGWHALRGTRPVVEKSDTPDTPDDHSGDDDGKDRMKIG